MPRDSATMSVISGNAKQKPLPPGFDPVRACDVVLLISTEMKLPGGDNAIVDIAELRDYCLDPQHPRGRHKARVFAASLGLAQTDAEFFGKRCFGPRARPMRWWANLTNSATASLWTSS